jgi:predicted MPP superfamily phosphohydrolase
MDGAAFIVSRGLAKESTRVPRLFNPPELVLVDVT